MCREVENPMVLDRHWAEHEKQPQVVGECAGCEEDIYRHEQWLDMGLGGHIFLVHQDKECCYQFVSGISRCCGGEE